MEWLEGKNSEAKKTTLNPDTQVRWQTNRMSSSSSSEQVEKTPATTPIINITAANKINTTAASESLAAANGEANIKKQTANKQPSVGTINSELSSENKENAQVNPKMVVFRNASQKPAALNHENGQVKIANSEIEVNSSGGDVVSNVVLTPSASSATTVAQQQPKISNAQPATLTADRKTKAKSVYYQSKYKYINGKAANRNEHITNIRNLSTMWPSECNGFQINSKHAAYFLAGSSGQIGIIELNKPGRLADTSINSIVNKSKVSDFQWDPFDDETLACGKLFKKNA
jgi:hypothetical protein